MRLFHGDCVEVLRGLPDCSVDSVVTDPPYELGFMGKGWDASGVACSVELWAEVLRVLKPGGHLLAFGGTRTYHRMACAIEDAGFEIRDSLHWIYGSGFPKSLNIGKTVQSYEGWGTALKPAHEPIVLARKPLIGTVAANVLQYGTGGLNIDGCRVGSEVIGGGTAPDLRDVGRRSKESIGVDKLSFGQVSNAARIEYPSHVGRWPANIVHDGSPEVTERFPDTGKSTGGRIGKKQQSTVGNVPAGQYEAGDPGYGDEGSAARFFPAVGFDEVDVASFMYCPKAGKKERNAGLEGMEAQRHSDRKRDDGAGGDNPRNRTNEPKQNFHPTVKPIALMRWLIRLITPPNGTVLDPFAGSGTTLVAAIMETRECIGIEITDEYLPIIEGRVAWAEAQPQKLV